MIFPYRERSHKKYPSDPSIVTYQPIVPIEVFGPTGSIQYDAIADTGSEITVFPNLGAGKDYLTSIKDSLRAIDGTSREVTRGKNIWLSLVLDGEMYKWPCDVWFSPNPNSKPTLGHKGFLEYFTATFDGKKKELTLKPNKDFPGEAVDLWSGN